MELCPICGSDLEECPAEKCHDCKEWVCSDCILICKKCNATVCDDCAIQCEHCKKIFCQRCYEIHLVESHDQIPKKKKNSRSKQTKRRKKSRKIS